MDIDLGNGTLRFEDPSTSDNRGAAEVQQGTEADNTRTGEVTLALDLDMGADGDGARGHGPKVQKSAGGGSDAKHKPTK